MGTAYYINYFYINSKSTAHMQNTGRKSCLLWCISAFIHRANLDRENVPTYKNYLNKTNIRNLQSLLKTRVIGKFEKLSTLKINV